MSLTLSSFPIRSPAIYLSAITLLATASCATGDVERSTACLDASDVPADLGRNATATAIAVAAVDDRFEPACIEVARGRVTIVVRNDGRHPHDLTLTDGDGVAIDSGQVAFLDTIVDDRAVRFTCTLHPGMDGELRPSR